jgi:hypothetical protein
MRWSHNPIATVSFNGTNESSEVGRDAQGATGLLINLKDATT